MNIDSKQKFILDNTYVGYTVYTDFDINKLLLNVIGDEEIKITQDQDITKVKYWLSIANDAIEKIYLKIKNKWVDSSTISTTNIKGNLFRILIDFNNRIEKVKLIIRDELCDDIILTINYVEADKEAYYKRIEEEKARIREEKRQELLKNLHYRIITGQNILNVIFDTENSKVAKTKVLLTYWLHDKYLTICEKVLGKNEHWVAFTDLGFATYSIVIEQYDKNGSLIVKSDNIQTIINR